MSESDRMPHFINILRDAQNEGIVRQAAGHAGLKLAGFYTDADVAAVAYATEGVRLHGKAMAWDAYERMARGAIERGGALFRLTATRPEWDIAIDQLRMFSDYCIRQGVE